MKKNNQTLLVWGSPNSPPLGYQNVVLWKSYGFELYPKAVSIPKLVEENADDLKKQYLKIIYDLGEKNLDGKSVINHLQLRKHFNYWWMTLINEKCNWAKSLWINDAIRLLAFEKLINEQNIYNLKLVSSNVPLASCFRLLCKKRNIIFVWQRLPEAKEKQFMVKRSFKLLPGILKSLVWLLYYVVRRWPLKGAGIKEWKSTKGQITFVSYLFNLEPEPAAAGRFESRYWAHLPDSLSQNGIATNWLHIYDKQKLLPTAKNAADTVLRFNQKGRGKQIHTTLDSFLSCKVLRNFIFDWIHLLKAGRKLRRLDSSDIGEGLYLWPFIQMDLEESLYGLTALNNLLYFNLFEQALELLPEQKRVFYLQENQGWEFGLIQVWKKASQGDLIGVPHSTVRFWDLRYFFDSRSYNGVVSSQLPRPNMIAVNGKLSREAYCLGGYPQDELVDVEALRYLHLKTLSKKSDMLLYNNEPIKVLILGDYLAEKTHYQMRILEEAYPSFSNYVNLTVKSHPNCPIIAEDYPNLKMHVTMDSISNLLNKCDVAYTSNITSAAIDAYCVGVPVISSITPNTLNMSPLRGIEEVEFVSTADKLLKALKKMKSSPRNHINPESFFWLNPDLLRWGKILSF